MAYLNIGDTFIIPTGTIYTDLKTTVDTIIVERPAVCEMTCVVININRDHYRFKVININTKFDHSYFKDTEWLIHKSLIS